VVYKSLFSKNLGMNDGFTQPSRETQACAFTLLVTPVVDGFFDVCFYVVSFPVHINNHFLVNYKSSWL